MENDITLLLLVAGAFLLAGIVFAWWLLRTIHREEEEHQKVLRSPQAHVHSFHVKDPMWRYDAHGPYLQLDDGHRYYWSKDFDSDDVSS